MVTEEEEEEEKEEEVKKEEVEYQERGRMMVVDTRYLLPIQLLLVNFQLDIVNFQLTPLELKPTKPQNHVQDIIVSHRQRGLGGALLCPGQQVASFTPVVFRVAKCQIFYTERIFQTKFYPKKSA